ncbi:clostripain-related cysteine peptidase [uncultured Alistipes sp.]|jgi:hypothetical protein|uniref:clostripain-related cysteine peptidase n=1 Tax=uncultured Alistipes sp. TaxID=538949 RepID=UPI0025F0DB51|nr:clostripain-related cysteine peptidase [uncultured Alistipes sp.]
MIRRILFLLPALILFAACESDKPQPKLSVDPAEVILRSDAGSESSFTVTAERAWALSVTGSGFDVYPKDGEKGESTVTVTATDDNTGHSTKTLGSITLIMDGTSKPYDVTVSQSGIVAPQTVIMYLPWSDNLYDYFLRNINDAKKAISKNIMHDSRMLVFLQTSTTKATLSELYYDNGECKEIPLKTYDDLNVTKEDALVAIFKDMAEAAPAEQYGLTIGSHGMAWIPDTNSEMRSMGVVDTEKPHWEYVSPDGVFTRWFGDGKTRCTNTTTFARAIAASGISFEYILFDDCFMSSIEVVYDLRNITKYIIASPCEVMAYGYPYDLVVPNLFTNNGAGYDLSGICHAFYDFYTTYSSPYGAIAVTVCDQVEQMAEVMKEVNTKFPVYNPDPAKPLQRYDYLYSQTRFYDFGDYVDKLCESDRTLFAKFEAQLNRTVPEQYRLHTEYFYSGGRRHIDVYSGISTSAPSESPLVLSHIENTGWHRATH